MRTTHHTEAEGAPPDGGMNKNKLKYTDKSSRWEFGIVLNMAGNLSATLTYKICPALYLAMSSVLLAQEVFLRIFFT